jgi:hypothetical protein
MILEELLGNATFGITRNGKAVQLTVGDEFTDAEYMTRTVYGDSGKAVIRIDQNCTVEIGVMPAPEIAAPTSTSTPAKTKAQPVAAETPPATE